VQNKKLSIDQKRRSFFTLKSPHKKSIVQEWFDRVEISFSSEAHQAGLIEHSSTVGSAREFIIKKVLKSILPPIVHVGSGKVIDAFGNSSCQIDIIIYDSRFPLFEVEKGIGLYPLEGVIAILEVKSTITKQSLRDALENTMSFINLKPGFEDPSPWKERIKKHMSTGLTKEQAHRKTGYEFIPASYVFAFNTRLRKKGLALAVDEWFEAQKNPSVADGYCAVLPRLIAAGESIGLLHDEFFIIDPGNELIQEWEKDNKSKPRHIMNFWDTKRRFGWMMIHLIHTTCSRIGLSHALSGAKYGVDHYLNIKDYFERDFKGKKSWSNLW